MSSPTSTSGKLSWKLTYSGLSGRVTGVQLRQGTKILARLCIVACSSGVHRTPGARRRDVHRSEGR